MEAVTAKPRRAEVMMTKKALLWMGMVTVLAVSVAAQQTWQRHYDPATETTVTGTVEDVVQVAHQGRSPGTHLKLKTDSGSVTVQIGPTSYLESQKVSFAKGDQVTVTGSKVNSGIIAREVKKGDRTLTLRDKQGIPKWSRGRNRPS